MAAKRKSGRKTSSSTGGKTVGKTGRKTSRRKTSAAKRTLVTPRGNNRYVRRDSKGRIKESDEQSRSLRQDRRRTAKKRVQSGQGDRGDRKASTG